MYFERYLNDLDTFFMLLQTHFGTKLTERNSLIIFDEVQMFPQARAAIKYLVGEVDSVLLCLECCDFRARGAVFLQQQDRQNQSCCCNTR